MVFPLSSVEPLALAVDPLHRLWVLGLRRRAWDPMGSGPAQKSLGPNADLTVQGAGGSGGREPTWDGEDVALPFCASAVQMPLLLFHSLHNDWNQVAHAVPSISIAGLRASCCPAGPWLLDGLSVGESGFATSQARPRVLCSITMMAHSENPVRTTISFHVHQHTQRRELTSQTWFPRGWGLLRSTETSPQQHEP